MVLHGSVCLSRFTYDSLLVHVQAAAAPIFIRERATLLMEMSSKKIFALTWFELTKVKIDNV